MTTPTVPPPDTASGAGHPDRAPSAGPGPAPTGGGAPAGGPPPPGATPGAVPGARPVWWRRRGFLVGVGVVAVIGASVVSDLPTHTSRRTDIAGETTVIGEVTSDVAPCVFAVKEAATLYGDETSGALLTAGNRAQIPALLRDDQDACSFTDDSIFQLSDIDVPGSPAGKDMGQAVNSATVWATSDALAVIEDIQSLTTDPGDARARRDLGRDERLLALDRDRVDGDVDAAGRALDTTLPRIALATVTVTAPVAAPAPAR